MSHEYYNLSIAYYLNTHLLASRSIWLNQVTRIQGVRFTQAAYSQNAYFIALSLKTVFSIYHKRQIVKVYGFDHEVHEIVVAGQYIFLKLGDGTIVGCNQRKQVPFLEWQEIPITFGNHDFENVLLGGDEWLLEVGKGIAKCFKLIHAQQCSLSDTRGKSYRQTIDFGQVAIPNDP